MSRAGNEFMMMRMEEESGQLYVPSISKKEVQAKAKEDATAILDQGEKDIAGVVIDATRLNEYLTTLIGVLKPNVTESDYGKDYQLKNGKISFRASGDRLDYESDLVYLELKERLKEREDLLKLAYKSKDIIFDGEGVEVSKVGIKTHSKDSVVITY